MLASEAAVVASITGAKSTFPDKSAADMLTGSGIDVIFRHAAFGSDESQ